MTKKVNIFGHLKSDMSSGLVVFLVALPLCLGIALASGAPPLAGIISGIIGGLVVGLLSNSHLSVSGPAAGLTAIILTAVSELGAYEIFLAAVVAAGLIQLVLGFLKMGIISNYFPNNVIEGMLAGIGIIIVLKQIPLALGQSGDLLSIGFEGLPNFIQSIHYGALTITLISLAILIGWEKVPALKRIKAVPAALVAVVVGIVLNGYFTSIGSALAITAEHLVSLPVPESLSDWGNFIVLPEFGALANPKVWTIALTIAVVASIETLLCVEAADRMDDQKRITDTNNELKAQGIGNLISGMLGGLPMTSVVVRTSANKNAGAKTKMSAMFHGVLLLLCVLAIPSVLNMIPLATLAAVLLMVGYKLAKPSLFKHFFSQGKYQFAPFIVTLVGVVTLDLLKGVTLGIGVCILAILRGNLKRAYHFDKAQFENGDVVTIELAQEVSFLNKAAIKSTLHTIPEGATVVIDASDTVYIAHDILNLIEDFTTTIATDKNIEVILKGFKKEYNLENSEEFMNHVKVNHPQLHKTVQFQEN